jgi:hypothetical protein
VTVALKDIFKKKETYDSSFFYVLFCIFCFYRASWHYSATLTEAVLCFFLGYKANVRVQLAKTGTAGTLPKLTVLFFMVCA